MRPLLAGARRLATEATASRMRLLARAKGVHLDLDLAPGARLEPGAHVSIDERNGLPIAVRIQPGARVRAGATLALRGGAVLLLGPSVEIRRGAVLNVSGRARFEGHNLVSWGSVVHCAESVTFEEMAGTGEMVTVVDGTHYRATPDSHWYHHARTAPVLIGRNAWLAPKSTVTAGVTIGAGATVGAGAVVLDDVPGGRLAVGAPARDAGPADDEGES